MLLLGNSSHPHLFPLLNISQHHCDNLRFAQRKFIKIVVMPSPQSIISVICFNDGNDSISNHGIVPNLVWV